MYKHFQMIAYYPYLFFVLSAFIGLWALASLVSALIQNLPFSRINKYLKMLIRRSK